MVNNNVNLRAHPLEVYYSGGNDFNAIMDEEEMKERETFGRPVLPAKGKEEKKVEQVAQKTISWGLYDKLPSMDGVKQVSWSTLEATSGYAGAVIEKCRGVDVSWMWNWKGGGSPEAALVPPPELVKKRERAVVEPAEVVRRIEEGGAILKELLDNIDFEYDENLISRLRGIAGRIEKTSLDCRALSEEYKRCYDKEKREIIDKRFERFRGLWDIFHGNIRDNWKLVLIKFNDEYERYRKREIEVYPMKDIEQLAKNLKFMQRMSGVVRKPLEDYRGNREVFGSLGADLDSRRLKMSDFDMAPVLAQASEPKVHRGRRYFPPVGIPNTTNIGHYSSVLQVLMASSAFNEKIDANLEKGQDEGEHPFWVRLEIQKLLKEFRCQYEYAGNGWDERAVLQVSNCFDKYVLFQNQSASSSLPTLNNQFDIRPIFETLISSLGLSFQIISRCSEEGEKVVREEIHEPEALLTLNVPSEMCTLQELINRQFSYEEVVGEPGMKTKFAREIKVLGKLPGVMGLSLTSNDKSLAPQMPKDLVIDLSEMVDKTRAWGSGHNRYQIIGVMCSIGTLYENQHNVSFVNKGDCWYLCDDDEVKKIKKEFVPFLAAKILILERLPG